MENYNAPGALYIQAPGAYLFDFRVLLQIIYAPGPYTYMYGRAAYYVKPEAKSCIYIVRYFYGLFNLLLPQIYPLRREGDESNRRKFYKNEHTGWSYS